MVYLPRRRLRQLVGKALILLVVACAAEPRAARVRGGHPQGLEIARRLAPQSDDLAQTDTAIIEAKWDATGAASEQTTVVTGYFRMASKHSTDEYDKWMSNMLAMQDCMVIFASPSMVPKITELRRGKEHRTRIIPTELDTVPAATDYSLDFWQMQLNMDPEKALHKSHELFWVWLSKAHFVAEAIKINPFESDLFVWCDIGSFREDDYGFKGAQVNWVMHPEVVPASKILVMAHTAPRKFYEPFYESRKPLDVPPNRAPGGVAADMLVTPWLQKDVTDTYVAGSHLAGHKKTWLEFEPHFEQTVSDYAARGLFVGEDQPVIQAACLNSRKCVFATEDCMTKTSWPFTKFFGLIRILHSGNRGCNYSTAL
jgi:hypothetical protein